MFLLEQKNMKYGFLLIILLGCFKTNSQTCCSGGVPLSNNLGLPNEGKNSWIFGLNYDYNNLNTLKSGTERLEDNSRLRITNSILLNTSYSFTDKFSAELLLTWVNQTRTIRQFGNENFTETSGIGDAVLLFKYAIQNILGENTLLNLGIGTKVPLGKSDLISKQGIQLTADLQPGSGAFDGIGWLSLSKKLKSKPSALIFGNLSYRLTGVNDSYLNNTSTYEFGNELQVNLGYSDQFLLYKTLFSPKLTFKYRKALRDKINNNYLPNTGGEWVFVRPELSSEITSNIVLNSKIELPIYSYVDGTQLSPTLRLTVGFTYKLNKKKTSTRFIKF